MAEFTADLNPKNTGMSLGDMMKMGLYSAQTDVLNREAQVAREKEKELPLVQTWAKSKDNLLEDGSYDLKQLPALIAMAPLTGPDFAKNIMELTKNHIATNKALNELSEDNRKPFASIYANYGQIAANGQKVTSNEVINSLERLKEFYPQLSQAADGQIKGWKARPQDQPIDPQSLLKARNESLTPTQLIDQFSPKAGTAQIGGATVQTTTQPSIMGEAPKITTSQLGGGQQMEPTKTSSTLPSLISEDKNLSYTGSVNPLNLSDIQKDRYKAGQTEFDNARIIQGKQKDLQQAVRKVEEFMGSASGSKGYQMIQQGGKWIFGNSDLDSLVKNIAQVQARNAEVMGLNNNIPAQELNAKLSGSEKIDEKALAGVMQQVKAESKAVELYSEGLKKFVEKRGDINGFIQANKFQSKWSDHYDPRIFQVDNIASSNIAETEKSAKIKDITSRMSDDEFKKYKEDRVVIHRLAKGLYQ
ncbi:hypothetical protein UFOVP1022_57 [uncultured Caudovirales phage]|uniref:Uncharacterized protein n=1 Tax=uncultured Caudovirales phage TaxID=2100421 RepID=A0A6J5QNL9_9CAUD|nr:hypothetical protein UFOVP1022_57 [uncultured Caudovirales phage]CAB4184166.1 hypothetical protein UFOVP1110_41 [uncultured Caudovirales phage]CAB4202836.1 hypothetical protein UFOVP1378_43 [uncultured Caudovirales phage]CAB4215623.1 hypothetical protein UFOVP1474_43 [uncultured Caudovirales phage]CAB5230041.1 hypothetical protein UFOVP1561_27 [uncultured Caudovirales phage]